MYIFYVQNNMYFINIHANIQTLTNVALFYIDKKLANHPIYRYTTINREVVPMKQKCMWLLFKMGLSLFTPDYMSQGRENDEHQEREAL